ncbi:uncharacterized protein LOC114751602 [Neltuma alba]|uniref:uncharacterized protein LOC114751602 n=1 Tax=Neltuma alba TaxID=207710 RepID=UPI0010A58FEA|nr:uncharacterized protein LOC114751602 [Prosopis alba]
MFMNTHVRDSQQLNLNPYELESVWVINFPNCHIPRLSLIYSCFCTSSRTQLTSFNLLSPSMASATSIHQRRLREFLKEQQEPFILNNYLSERGCSRTWCLQRSANSCLNINAKLQFSRVLASLCKKLALHNESSNVMAERPAARNEDLVVRETPTIGEIVVETERSSSSSSSTLFYSCSEVDEDESSFSSDNFQASNVCPTGMQSQQATNNGKHRWRCIGPASLGKVPSRRASASQNEVVVNQEVRKIEKKIHSCSVPLPKKMREESISSAASWGLLMQSVKRERGSRKVRDNVAPSVSQGFKSIRVLQKTKQLLFHCARETLAKKDKGEQCHNKELGKFICKRTTRWGQRSRHGRGLTCLFSLDDLNSVYEWGDLEPHANDIILQIGDAILESISNEIVSEFIEY